MQKKIYSVLACIFFFTLVTHAQDEYLKIDTSVTPTSISQGEEGVLKIKITPRSDIKIPSISSHLGFMIKFEDNANLSFPKVFFTASELDLQMKQENDSVYLEFEKEIPITFKVAEDSLLGKHKISGEVIFTAVFKDNWSVKTYQKFNADFYSKRNRKTRKR
jgi:hypothetical protein